MQRPTTLYEDGRVLQPERRLTAQADGPPITRPNESAKNRLGWVLNMLTDRPPPPRTLEKTTRGGPKLLAPDLSPTAATVKWMIFKPRVMRNLTHTYDRGSVLGFGRQKGYTKIHLRSLGPGDLHVPLLCAAILDCAFLDLGASGELYVFPRAFF